MLIIGIQLRIIYLFIYSIRTLQQYIPNSSLSCFFLWTLLTWTHRLRDKTSPFKVCFPNWSPSRVFTRLYHHPIRYMVLLLLSELQTQLFFMLPWNSPTMSYMLLGIHRIIKKVRDFQKNIYFCFVDYTKAFDCVDHNKLWKIVKEMGTLDHFTCLLRNLCTGQTATVRTGYGTMDCFKIGKGVCQGYILPSCLFNLMQRTSCEMPGWMKHKLKSRLLGEIPISWDMQMTPPLWQKAKRN